MGAEIGDRYQHAQTANDSVEHRVRDEAASNTVVKRRLGSPLAAVSAVAYNGVPRTSTRNGTQSGPATGRNSQNKRNDSTDQIEFEAAVLQNFSPKGHTGGGQSGAGHPLAPPPGGDRRKTRRQLAQTIADRMSPDLRQRLDSATEQRESLPDVAKTNTVGRTREHRRRRHLT